MEIPPRKPKFSDEQVRFFEQHVRPLLVDRCHECHADENRESGLRLDSRRATIEGGDRGPAIIVGNPNGSLLIKALSYEDDELAMPPDGKLPLRDFRMLQQWIAMGAPWPNVATQGAESTNDSSDALHHWAFQPIRKLPIPTVNDAEWPENAIDHFILARLESDGLTPSPAADPQTLVRRVYLDLIGLPPSYDDVQQFARMITNDISESNAYNRLVDELLARREYGERWARHWLDVARYADTKGYVDGGQREFAFAYTYRDYVIRAMNDDLPFDQFVVDQLAADQQTFCVGDRWRLAAMGFLTVGRRFNHNPYDILDDRIDVISRGLQALTVSCARCHDHKFDPIPTADYYSLYGILASAEEPQHPDLPVVEAAPNTKEYRDYVAELSERDAAFRDQFNRLHRQIERELREFATDYLVYIVKESPRHRGQGQNPLRTERTFLRGPSAYAAGAIRRWRNYIYRRDANDPVFGLWHRLDPFGRDEFAVALAQQLAEADIHPRIAKAIHERQPTSMVELARCYGKIFEETYAEYQRETEQTSAIEEFAEGDLEPIRQVLYGPDSPTVMSATESIECYHLDESTSVRNKAGEIEKLSLEHRDVPGRAMILKDSQPLHQPVVFLRGQHTRPGQPVPRQLPQLFLVGGPREAFRDRSGRLELARQIASPHNRLTARVIVNRIWNWHFGQPLVETPSDFGIRSTPPTHPELLDYLAQWFLDNDWSLKRLHRLIVTSRTYRQSNQSRAALVTSDPENRLYWRFAPRRLDWESLRDSLLLATGQLEPRIGGRPIGLSPDALDCKCRTIYLTVDRQHVSSFARDFDFPSPDMTVPRRGQTIVPQQQLFFLNSPFVIEQAQAAARFATVASQSDSQNIVALFRQILSRDPEANELAAANEYVQNLSSAWARLAQALLQSSEFIYVP